MAAPPENWEQIKELFDAALEVEPARRLLLLEERCRNTNIRAEVERLLSEHDEAGAFLSTPVIGNLTFDALSPPEPPSLDSYQMLELIGEGGMGQVWLADQIEPVRRHVAIKLIKAGMDTREVLARFESERQALALMDHPAIAKVFDAGVTREGRPYFVMEYVAGTPITAYCDQQQLSTRERLELFARVCEGVQHAHQKAIIHRDLKPSNILVTQVDGKPVPKIIDFGVAKALTEKMTAQTMLTRAGALIGTPEYMSPEQALSSGEDIDTRTDVYSLGVIFYELLAGAPPIELHKVALDEFLRRLREEDAPRPSTKFRIQARDTSLGIASKRQTEPQALAKLMQGELDSIALKALEKDRARRYGSPSEFGADIGRYLRNETVLAVPPSVPYRARKFVRRYRGVLATTFAVVLVLIVATGVSILMSVRAAQQRDRANTEAATSQAINDFLRNDVLAQASAASQSEAASKPDPHLEVRTALDRAAAHIAGKFGQQPEIEAAIRETIGQTYADLGLYAEAQAQFERAVALDQRVFGPDNSKSLRAMSRLGVIAFRQGRYTEAEALLSQTLQVARRVEGPERPDTLSSMTNLASAYRLQGKYAQAEALVGQALEIKRRVLGLENNSTVVSMTVLAEIYEEEGKYAQAQALCSQALEIERRVLGPEHPNTLNSMNNLANLYRDQGKYVQAETLHGQTLEIRRRVLGPEHPFTLSAMNNLAKDLSAQGKYRQAEALFSQTLVLRDRVLGARHPDTMDTAELLAVCWSEDKQYARALRFFRETIAQAMQVGMQSELAEEWYNFACVEAVAGHNERALEYLQKAADLGSSDILKMSGDSNLKSLHGDPRFNAMIAQANAAQIKDQGRVVGIGKNQ
jgi:eukaryotic-like serine/threonine-protein kinase